MDKRSSLVEVLESHLSVAYTALQELANMQAKSDNSNIEDIEDKARDQAIYLITYLGLDSHDSDKLGNNVMDILQTVLMMAVMCQPDILDMPIEACEVTRNN